MISHLLHMTLDDASADPVIVWAVGGGRWADMLR